MGQNPAQLVVANGDAECHVWVAPVGTTLPDDESETLDAAFIDIGLVDENGVKFAVTRTRADFGAWQTEDPILTLLTARTCMATYALRQWNSETVPFAFGGGEVTEPTPGHFQYDFPDLVVDERCSIVEWTDGTYHHRIIIPRGVAAENVETDLTRVAPSNLPVGFSALKAAGLPIARYFSDFPALAASGS